NREAEALLRLQHAGLARVYEQGRLDNARPYLRMEYLKGLSLDRYLATNGPMKQRQVVEIFLPVCDALASAHEKGLIHRDLKPSNLFLQEEGGKYRPKILDFGLAKMRATEGGAMASLTQSGEV